MRIQLISDVHVEFDDDKGHALVESLDPEVADVLVCAGDMGASTYAVNVMRDICEKYAPKPVLWVHGNHEYYGTTRLNMLLLSHALEQKQSNLHFLDKRTVELTIGEEKRRFLGATLWYENKFPREWSDYSCIEGLSTWLQEESDSACKFLTQQLRPDDIIVTHMLPSKQCVHPKWQSSFENCYFIRDMTDFIVARAPKLWLYGHTHDHMDVMVGKTRCVNNPRGYPHENMPFDPNFVIEA